MSYMRDRDTMLRGVGAIAAADARSPQRLAARRARAAVMRKIDARRAMLAHGPGRKLPVAMGAIKTASTGRLQSMFAPTIKSGGVLEAPPNGPYGRPPQMQPLPPATKPPTVSTPPLPPLTRPPRSFPVNTVGLPVATVKVPGGSLTPVTGSGSSGTVIVDPVPGSGSASTGEGSSGGGGGGGGGEWTFPSDDEPELTPPDTTVEEPPVASSSSTGRNLLLIGAGIGLLYLLTRDDD